MSKKVSYIFILSLILLTVAGVIFGFWLYTSQDKLLNKTTIVLNEQTKTEMEVNLAGISPGTSTSYEICLKANRGDGFDVTVDFEEAGSNSIASYVDVEIRLDGEKIDSAKLTEYLDGRKIEFRMDFDGTSEVFVEIIYSMSADVGDEAQNTTADFNIVLSAER